MDITDSKDEDACEFHPNAYLISDMRAGDRICTECGRVVVGRAINCENEWRTLSANSEEKMDDPSRVGGREESWNINQDLETLIGPTPMAGRKCVYQFKSSSANRKFNQTCKELDEFGERLHLTKDDVVHAKEWYGKCSKDKRFMMKKTVLAASVLYVICKMSSPRTMKEVSIASGVDIKLLNKCTNKLLEVFEELRESKSFLVRFCTLLELTKSTQMKAEQLYEKTPAKVKMLQHNYNERLRCAVAIYIAAVTELKLAKEVDLKKWRERIKDISGVPQKKILDVSHEYLSAK